MARYKDLPAPVYPDPAPVPKPPNPFNDAPPTPKEIATARRIIRRLITEGRWGHSGGYVGFRGGRWTHGMPLGHASGKDAEALCAFAGVTPDEIVSRGDCADCANADNGSERGYAEPCGSCKRPYHSNFVPAAEVRRKKDT